MNMQAIIGLIVAVVVVGGGVWYFSSGGPGGNPATTMMEGEGAVNEDAQGAMGSGTFADIMRMAGSFECTVNDAESGTDGKVYVSNGNVRGDFTSTMNGQSYATSFINADGYIYTWSDAAPQGMKMLAPAMDAANGDSSQDSQMGVNMEARVDYSCAPWAANQAAFAPPANVEFMDFSTGAMPAGFEMPQ